MKSIQKIFLILCICAGLCGCSQNPVRTAAPPSMVTAIQITGDHRGHSLQRYYTSPEKMQMILNYLRLLNANGNVHWDPELLPGDVYTITMNMSDGKQRVYCQRANRYLSRDAEPWQNIDRKQAQQFYYLLLLTPTDM